MIKYILSDNWDDAISSIARKLNSELKKGNKVLWLVSGGSQIEANVRIMSRIDDSLSHNLSVSLIDERYGPVGHADSNWSQLMSAGFPTMQATLLPVIKDGLDFKQNTEYFKQMLEHGLNENDRVIGQLGIGPDGHTAGILPHSPACKVGDNVLVVGYSSPPYQRMSMTLSALKKLNTAYVLAFGDNKKEALTNLKQKSLPLEEQPAQILKKLKSVYVYNDQVGGD